MGNDEIDIFFQIFYVSKKISNGELWKNISETGRIWKIGEFPEFDFAEICVIVDVSFRNPTTSYDSLFTNLFRKNDIDKKPRHTKKILYFLTKSFTI